MPFDINRWAYAMAFAGLDAIRPFARDLWLPRNITESAVVFLRQAYDDLRQDGGADRADLALLKLSRSVGSANNSIEFSLLATWVHAVLVKGGEDRAAEGIWRHICYRMLYHKIDAPQWIAERLSTVARLDKEIQTDFKNREAADLARGISEWDRACIETTFGPDAVPDILAVTVTANIFSIAWKKTCHTITLEELESLTEFANRNAGSLDLTGVVVHVPGTWELEYAHLPRE